MLFTNTFDDFMKHGKAQIAKHNDTLNASSSIGINQSTCVFILKMQFYFLRISETELAQGIGYLISDNKDITQELDINTS